MSKEEKFLYLEGLAKFQAGPDGDIKDPLSYYQIAGIHGLPYQTWPALDWNKDIKEPEGGDKKERVRGFCTHTSILFLTWHRPYLALFEAVLYKHVNDIASGIDDSSAEKAKYVAAAKEFRMPYWDWARKNVSIFPEEALSNEISFSGPPSRNSVHPKYNPLFQAPFHEGACAKITLGYATTIRYPKKEGSHPKKEDPHPMTEDPHPKKEDPQNELIQLTKKFYEKPGEGENGLPKPPLVPERNLTERVSYILRAYQRYGSMSNNLYQGDNKGDVTKKKETWGGLEDIHNVVHGLTGGPGGHMSSIKTSAFDPIFWLHHTNIDRLYAIWQALHEDDHKEETFVTTQSAGRGSFAVLPGDKEGIDTPLYPFRDTESSWYTSRKVKRTEPFGYAYPETAGLNYPTSDSAKETLIKVIQKIYPDLSDMIRESKDENPEAGMDLLPQAKVLKEIAVKKLPATTHEMMNLVSKLPNTQALLKNSIGDSKPYIRDLAPDNKYLEWLINISAPKHALDGTFTVHTFLGPVDEEQVYLWPASPHHVGTFAPLGQPGNTSCDKCQQDQRDDVRVTGQIPLTLALVERYLNGTLDNLSVDEVERYLQKNLHWRVARGDGTIVNTRSDVRGLVVFVVSNEVTVPKSDGQLPIYAPDVTIHPEITTNMDREGRGDGTGLTAGQIPS